MGLFNKKLNKEENKSRKEGKNDKNSEIIPEEKAIEAGEGKIVLPKGKSAGAYDSIYHPFITEKSNMLGQSGQYVFKVAGSANKNQVKKAIEDLYGVRVDKVRVVNLPSKTRHVGKQIGVKSGFKKALVKLRSGESIQLT